MQLDVTVLQEKGKVKAAVLLYVVHTGLHTQDGCRVKMRFAYCIKNISLPVVILLVNTSKDLP